MGWQVLAGITVRALASRVASKAAMNAARTSSSSYVRKYGPRYVTGLGVVSKVQDAFSVSSMASDYFTRSNKRTESATSKKGAISTDQRSRSMTSGYLRKYSRGSELA